MSMITNMLVGAKNKISSYFAVKNRVIYSEYAILALFVLFPLMLKSGYVFAPDMVFTPIIRLPLELNSFNFLRVVFWLLNFILPGWVIQKLIMFLILWLAGVGMHKLVPTRGNWPKYFAGIFYMFNPFVYSRFMYGQLLLLLVYALTPFAVRAILRFFNEVNFRNALRVGLWLVLIGVIDFRGVFFAGVFFVVAFLFYFFKNIKNLKWVGRLLMYSLAIGLMVFVLNSYWIVPTFLGRTSIAQGMATFDWPQQWAFRTTTDAKWGLFFNAAATYGFWGDAQQRYLSNKEYAPYWPHLFLVLFSLVIWGAISSFIAYIKKRKESQPEAGPPWAEKLSDVSVLQPTTSKLPADDPALNPEPCTLNAFIFLVVGLISYLLAIGVGAWCDTAAECHTACCNSIAVPAAFLTIRIFVGQALYHLTDFLNTYVPFYKGFREPQKFISLLILCYCYLGALGVDSLLGKLKVKSEKLKVENQDDGKNFKNRFLNLFSAFRFSLFTKFIPALFLILPILYAPGMLWGFRGQLYNSQYPKPWFEANEVLNQDKDLASRKWNGFGDGGKVLFFPWHSYLALSFANNKVVANPAPNFFDKEVITSDNMQMPGVLATSSRPFSVFFEKEILSRADEIDNLGELLAPWGIKYVMWAAESDFFNYLFVFKQKDLKVIYKSDHLILFENTRWSPY